MIDLYGLSKTGWNTLFCYIGSCSHWLENPLGFARDWKFGRRLIYCHGYAYVWPDDRPEKCHLTSIQLNGSKSDGWDICWSFLLAEVAAHGSRNWCTSSGKGTAVERNHGSCGFKRMMFLSVFLFRFALDEKCIALTAVHFPVTWRHAFDLKKNMSHSPTTV